MRHAREVALESAGHAFLLAFAREDASGAGILSTHPDGLLAAEALLPDLVDHAPSDARELVESWLSTSWEGWWGKASGNLEVDFRLVMTLYAIARWAPATGTAEQATRVLALMRDSAALSPTVQAMADGPREFVGVCTVSEAILADRVRRAAARTHSRDHEE